MKARAVVLLFPFGLIVLVALAVILVPAEAQQAGKVYRIGLLFEVGRTARSEDLWRGAFGQRGYVEGQNSIFEFRYAGERFESLPALAEELVRLKVDIIVTSSTPPAVAARRATSVIPIITTSADPIGAGLAASLARPGGNVTGVFLPLADLGAKRLQLLRETVPDLDSVAFVGNPLNETVRVQLKAAESAAKAMGVSSHVIEMRSQSDLDPVFAAIRAKRIRGLMVIQDPVTLRAGRDIAKLAAKHRLPATYPYREPVDAGGLMSYGPSNAGLREAQVAYADRVLRGAPAGDLPMEQPTKFELVINLKTAKALGLTIPPSLLLRADQVIE